MKQSELENEIDKGSGTEVVTDNPESISSTNCDISEEESDVEPTVAVGSDVYSCDLEVIGSSSSEENMTNSFEISVCDSHFEFIESDQVSKTTSKPGNRIPLKTRVVPKKTYKTPKKKKTKQTAVKTDKEKNVIAVAKKAPDKAMVNEDKRISAVLSETPHDEDHETLSTTTSAVNTTPGYVLLTNIFH